MASLFPIFLKIAGRRGVVVGAGKIAEQKLEALLAAEAKVHVVAPQASAAIRQLAAGGQLVWTARSFEPADLDGAAVAIAATGDTVVNAEVFRAAGERGVLCNAVDDPERCHFYYPAVVRRGDLQIAISTGGHSPALAQRLRAELATLFGRDYGPWLQWLGAVRHLLFRRQVDPQLRKQTLHRIASREVYDRFALAQQRHPREQRGRGQ